MSMFVVKRRSYCGSVASAGVCAKSCCAEMTREGHPVRSIRSFFLPETGQTHCYFEAASRQAVGEKPTTAPHRFRRNLRGRRDDAGHASARSRSRLR
jgi:hypothetical protein